MKVFPKLPHRVEILLDALLIFLLTVVLIRPLFKAKYFNKWGSIESTFISDARFLIEHWPHPQWQPLWYTGTRFDYIYPPALRYGTAMISKVTGYWPVKAYHVYTAFFYCVGVVGVYLLVSVGLKSRGAAWLAAVATALLSPSFLLLKNFRDDSWMWMPQRLHVLLQYGEGPHITALALIPFALAFSWRALEARRLGSVALAAIFSAAVVSHNFYGATALAIFYAVLVWSFWVTRQKKTMIATACVIPVLAYGLTAFWLVPSYIRITARNLKYVAKPGNWLSVAIALVVLAAFVVVTRRWARARPERTWAVFVSGSAVFFSFNVLGYYSFHFLVTGVPGRLIPELDMVYILGAVTLLGWVWRRGRRAGRVAAAAVVCAALATAGRYVEHARELFPLAPDYQNRVEYRISDWLWRHMAESRVFAIGSVRFWLDAWHDLAQVGGGSEQGLINGMTQNAQWATNPAWQPEESILWMQGLGADAIYVSDQRSEEIYKDVQHPEIFAGVLPVLYDDGHGNTIYKVPRRYPARARIVQTARLDSLPPLADHPSVENLRAYTDLIERGPDRSVSLVREGTDAMRVRARLEAGQSIVVQEAYDPAWQAWSGVRRLPVRQDAMGFLVVDASPGDREILLVFATPLENRLGRLVTVATALVLIGLFAGATRPRHQRE